MGPGDLCLCQGQWAVRSKPPLAFWDANKVLLLNRDLPPVEWRPPLRQEPRKTLGSHASPDGSGSASKEGVLGEPHSLPPRPKLGLSDRPRAWPSRCRPRRHRNAGAVRPQVTWSQDAELETLS